MPVEPSGLPNHHLLKPANSQTGDKLGPLFGFFCLIFLFATLVSLFLSGYRTSLVFWICLALGLAAFAAFAAKRFQAILHFFVSRQARYGANVAISILATLGIAIVLNVIVAQRFDKAVDWTADKFHTLSDQTKNILRGLDREVKVITFFSNSPDNPQSQRQFILAKDLLEAYKRETDKLTVGFVDPYADPQKAEVYDIKFDGTTVFESGGKRERVTSVDEQKFTSAIMKVVRDEVKKIYFLTGHEERSIDDYERSGYIHTKEELVNQNYKVATLTLAAESEVPADCAALIIPGPKTPLTAHELNAIAEYLDRNGKLFLLLDPHLGSGDDPHHRLVDLMGKWGITIGNDLVLDLKSSTYFFPSGMHPNAPLVDDFEFHQITQYVRRVTFQLARSVFPKTDIRKNLNAKSLAKTTDELGGSWGETKRKADGTIDSELSYTEGEDTPPPVVLAVAVQLEEDEPEVAADNDFPEVPKTSKTRIVAVGDADFASNYFFETTGGGDLFLNAVNWLTLEEDLIAIRPIDRNERILRRLTYGEAAFVQIASIFLIPLIIFFVGLVVWWRRR